MLDFKHYVLPRNAVLLVVLGKVRGTEALLHGQTPFSGGALVSKIVCNLAVMSDKTYILDPNVLEGSPC